jgi:predicted TIM-barrel fold metal-dependent hydrolase
VAERGLSFDVHSPPAWVAQAVRLAQLVPNLRLIINHVANATVNGEAPTEDWRELMKKLAAHPQVFMKVSGLVEGTKRRNGDAPSDVEYYRPVLEFLWKTFGADRLIYGSNWLVSARFAPLDRVEQIPLTFFAEKGQAALDKVFWKNAQTVYRWK